MRFPRNAEVVDAMHREMRLLPELARHVSFRVPVPVVCADDWFVYEKIAGREIEADDDVDAAFAMIRELHTFPVDEARRLLGEPRPDDAAWRRFESDVFPLLEDDLIDRLDVLRELPRPEPPSLVHADLGPEHLLVDRSGTPVGIIDFEEATIGDPAIDLMPLTSFSGRRIDERMWLYQCRGTLHALVYYVEQGMVEEVAGAVAELRRRLDSRPRR